MTKIKVAVDKAHRDARVHAAKAANEDKATAWRAYLDALTTAEEALANGDDRVWEEVDIAVDAAEEAYGKVARTAVEVHDKAVRAAEEAYDEANSGIAGDSRVSTKPEQPLGRSSARLWWPSTGEGPEPTTIA